MKYDVFISYSHKDYVDNDGNIIEGNIISRIKEVLTSNGYTFWFDEKGIYSGDEFVGVITEAIQNSEVFLYVSSVNSNNSDWTNHEIAVAKLLKKKTIPFKLDNTVYNTSILMYLAPLDTIDYQKNPTKAFDALVASLKNHYAKLEELKRRKQEEERRRQKKQEEAEAKLKLEEAKNKRLAAIDNEIAGLKVNIEKKTAEKIALQSNVDQLKEKINEYMTDVRFIEENISSFYLEISNLEFEKKSLLGNNVGHFTNDNFDKNVNVSNIVSETKAKYLSLKSLFDLRKKKIRIPSIGKIFKWAKDLNARYWFSLCLLFVFVLLFIGFASYLLFYGFDGTNEVEIFATLMSGGIVLGITQLFRKRKNGILILFYNGILGFFLGLFTLDSYRFPWYCGWAFYQFIVFIVYLIHKTDKVSEYSFIKMKGAWVKTPRLYFPLITLLFWGLSYLLPFAVATSAGMKNYNLRKCDDFSSELIRAFMGNTWSAEDIGDYYLNKGYYSSKDLLKKNPHKAYEWYLRAGLDENSDRIKECKNYFELAEKGYYMSSIYGLCGLNTETNEAVKIDILRFSGERLDSDKSYEFKILGKHRLSSLIHVNVEGAIMEHNERTDLYKLTEITGDSVKISYTYNNQLVSERVLPVKAVMPKLIGPTSYESGDRVKIKVKYPLKNAVWKIRYVDNCGDSRVRIVYSDDCAKNIKKMHNLLINRSSVDELHFRLFNYRYDYNKIIVEYNQSDNKSKSAQLIIEGREKEAKRMK